MTQISNAEKQARFRKKEHLKRRANSIFQEWQFRPDCFKSKTPENIKRSLDKAVDLPSGWTDKDYELGSYAGPMLFKSGFFLGGGPTSKTI